MQALLACVHTRVHVPTAQHSAPPALLLTSAVLSTDSLSLPSVNAQTGGKPSIELPSGEDFFNQHEHDNPEGFFDSLPDHPTPPADYTPSGMSAGGLDPNRRASSLGGAAANGITGEPSTPMGVDPNHIPEGAERVS